MKSSRVGSFWATANDEVEVVALGERVAYARTGIEEVILFVHVDGLHADLFRNEVVVDAPRLIADIAVLEVAEKAQPPGYGPRRAGEEVGVVLVYVVVVPAAADLAASSPSTQSSVPQWGQE